MSLVQHVSALEGADLENPETSLLRPHKTVKKVISYDALFTKPQSVEQIPVGGVAAYRVSTAKRIAQVVTVVLACWLASGIVFGFAALKPVLVDEGVYRELCTEQELEDDVELCYEQDLRLNFFFSLASTTTNVSALFAGALLDRYGMRFCYVVGCLSLLAGSLLMSYAFALPEFDGYTIANFFLALGGTFIFVPSFQISNAFPRYSGMIVATITGAFDASAAVFLFYRYAYEASGGAFSPDKFFLAYAAVPVLILLGQVPLLPPKDYKNIPQLEHKLEKAQDATTDVHESDDEIEDDAELYRVRSIRSDRRKLKIRKLDKLMGTAKERRQKAEHEDERQAVSGVWGVLHNRSASEQMLTAWFILITLLTVLQMVRMNYFIATIKMQYEYMLGSERLADTINHFFDIALPVAGVVCTPFLGLLLDSFSTAAMLASLVALISLIGIFGALPFLWAGYINVLLFVFLRPLYYSAMSDYATKVFGFTTFGRVYGTIICLSGLINLCNPAIDDLTKRVFHGNPIPVNIFLAAVATVIGIVLVVYVAVQARRLRQQREDAEEYMSVTDSLIPPSIQESIYE